MHANKIKPSYSHISPAIEACLATQRLMKMKRTNVRGWGSHLEAQLSNLDMCTMETTKPNHQLAKDRTSLRWHSHILLWCSSSLIHKPGNSEQVRTDLDRIKRYWSEVQESTLLSPAWKCNFKICVSFIRHPPLPPTAASQQDKWNKKVLLFQYNASKLLKAGFELYKRIEI